LRALELAIPMDSTSQTGAFPLTSDTPTLDAPVVRVAARDTFVPSAASLELMALPSVDDLRAGVEKVLHYRLRNCSAA